MKTKKHNPAVKKGFRKSQKMQGGNAEIMWDKYKNLLDECIRVHNGSVEKYTNEIKDLLQIIKNENYKKS